MASTPVRLTIRVGGPAHWMVLEDFQESVQEALVEVECGTLDAAVTDIELFFSFVGGVLTEDEQERVVEEVLDAISWPVVTITSMTEGGARQAVDWVPVEGARKRVQYKIGLVRTT